MENDISKLEFDLKAEIERQDNMLMSAFLCSIQTMEDAAKVVNSLRRIIKIKDKIIAELQEEADRVELNAGWGN